MATLIHLSGQGQLIELEAALSWREQKERRIYVFPAARTWMENILPQEASDWGLELTPLEQLGQFLVNYCAGRELTFERQFKPIQHIDRGVWELKTPDVRLFGWFALKDCFVCTFGNTKNRIKEYGLVGGYRDQTVRMRDKLDLDSPKFVTGDNPNDVVSAFSFPPS